MKHSTVLAAVMSIGLAFHAHAKLYTPVFTQSFDSAETYTANFYDGSVASDILGTSESDPGTAITGTAEQKQRYGAAEGEKFCYHNKTGSAQTNMALYKFPSSVTGLSDYKLEFDYYLSPAVGDYTRHSALVIKGSNGVVATFDKPAGGTNGGVTYDCNLIYGEGSSCTNTFSTGGRGSDPSNSQWAPYWLHVTIYGNATDGLFMSVAQDNGTVVLSDIRVGNFQTVDRLFFYVNYSRNIDYAKIFALDNVVCSSGANQTFTWTGAEEASKWAPPGNWTVDGEATTKYPEIGDAVSGLDATALAAMDIAVKLETSGGVTRFVNSCAKNVKVWTGAGTDTNWSTLENWGYTAGFAAYEIPAEGSTVVFPSTFTDGVVVTLTNHLCATDKPGDGYTFNLETDTTIQSASSTIYYLNPRTVSGNGKLTLGNVQVRTKVSDGACAFNVELCIKDSVTLYLRGGKAKITMSRALLGNGTLTLDADTNGEHSFTFTGDMGDFEGTLNIPQVLRNSAAGCSYSFNGDDSTIDLSGATVSIADPMTMTLGGTYDNNILKIGALTGAGTINNTTANALTLEIGRSGDNASSDVVLDGTETWTVKKIGSNRQTLTDATVAYNLTLAEGEIALPVGKTLGTVSKTGGKFAFAVPGDTWTDGEAHTLFTCSDGVAAETLTSADVTLDQNALTKTWLPVYDNSSANTLSVKLTEAEFVWAGGTSGRWDDDANWTVNGVAAPAAPKGGETVSIDGATVLIDTDTNISGVELSNGAKLALGFTDDNLNYTIPEDFSASDFVVAGPYTMAESEGVLTATRTASTFVWNGGASGEWTDAANWRVGGGYTGVVPGTGDTAVFGTSAEVLVSASAYAGETRLDADVTFSGEAKLQCPLWRGYGKLSLAGITLTAPTEGDFIISNNVEVVAKTRNTLTLETAASSSETDYRYIYLEGNMTGAGYLALDQRSRQGLAGGKFSGDNREFSGEIEVVNCKDNRDTTQFIGAHSTSSNAVYTVYGKGDDGNTVSMFPTQNTTYYIGSIDGNVQQARAGAPGNVILEIGALNRNNSIGGHFGASNKTGIRKVGTGTLSVRASNVGDVEIVGGTYEVTGNSQSGTVKFIGNGVFRSTIAKSGGGEDIDYAQKLDGSENYPIVFDDGGLERTWATAIKASNKAGFTKMGSGTLTLELAPKYTGWTTVKAGKLIVPEGTALDVVAGAGGEIEGATTNNLEFAEGYVFNAGTDGQIVATGAADVSNLTVYIANPTASGSVKVVRAGSITGTATLAFPAGTSEKVKAKWSLRSGNGTLKASSVVPFAIVVR